MQSTDWTINTHEYFEAPGLTALVFHNTYPEGKQGGIEIIQHGERVATNGDVRLEAMPGQWAHFPKIGQREIDTEREEAWIPLYYEETGLKYIVRVRGEEAALRVNVDLEQPLPEDLVGKVSFNLELFPPAYFGKSFHLGKTFGIFPRQANGPMEPSADGKLLPAPLATGPKLYIAPEDLSRKMEIEALSGNMSLFDGRNTAPNGWFVVRSIIPAGTTKNAIDWRIVPNSIPNWHREPVICISQVGYHPDQVKRAIIELDPQPNLSGTAILQRIEPGGEIRDILSSTVEDWGRFLCYTYGIFDFTEVQEHGMYLIRVGTYTSPPFKISRDVYQKDVWQPTLETFFPVQMCHMEICDGWRVWHGACHLDDALQAPNPHEHFDDYRQGASTDTSYAAYEHIPGLARGGWHDAGDYDLAAGSQATTTFVLALARETFGVDTDQTTVKSEERLVLLHTPDGIPDIVQQVQHGVENLLSGYRAAGHSFLGIIAGSLEQYVHLGDACTITDNRIYDALLECNEVVGNRSGKRDDRWAFTSRSTALEYQVATALAAASRVLRGYEDKLADECLQTALNVWDHEQTHDSVEHTSAYVPDNADVQEILAAVELLITTGELCYHERLIELWPQIEQHGQHVDWAIARVLPLIQDETFTANFRKMLVDSAEVLKDDLTKNPFGIPFHPDIWGIGWQLQEYAVAQFFLHQVFPDLFDRENVLRVLNYVLGCHPGSNISLVSGVGAESLTVAYGINRAEWSYIPGGNTSGPALIRPDFMELKTPFPFLWQQSEYVMPGAATYMFCVLAADTLLNGAGATSQ
jgi:hypothetical protein